MDFRRCGIDVVDAGVDDGAGCCRRRDWLGRRRHRVLQRWGCYYGVGVELRGRCLLSLQRLQRGRPELQLELRSE